MTSEIAVDGIQNWLIPSAVPSCCPTATSCPSTPGLDVVSSARARCRVGRWAPSIAWPRLALFSAVAAAAAPTQHGMALNVPTNIPGLGTAGWWLFVELEMTCESGRGTEYGVSYLFANSPLMLCHAPRHRPAAAVWQVASLPWAALLLSQPPIINHPFADYHPFIHPSTYPMRARQSHRGCPAINLPHASGLPLEAVSLHGLVQLWSR